jgi:hypothetical protein
MGRLHGDGPRFFRSADRFSAGYSFEQRHAAAFSPAERKSFRSNARAWAFFESQPPFYRRTATWWVVSAKRDETRARRLGLLMADSARGLRIGPMRREPSAARLAR